MKKLFLPFLFIASAAFAQESPFITILVPVSVPDAAPGAFGTLWQSEVWIYNGSDTPYGSVRSCGSSDPLFGCATHAPNTTEREFPEVLRSPFNAVLLYVARNDASRFTFSSRLFELSRHTQPVGVDVPVVREQDLFTSAVRFVGVSGGASSRVALRVYDPMRREGSSVRVELLTTKGDPIAEATLLVPHDPVIFYPGYTAILDLVVAFPQLHGVDRYDVRVTPLTAGMQYYALMSITDNDSQQVLLITANP